MDQKFPKSERLLGKKEIRRLFSEGNSFVIHPFKVLWCDREMVKDVPIKIAVGIPKKKFKKATDRNLLKRRTREAYRLNRNPLKQLLSENGKCINIMFIYLDNDKLSFEEIQLKIILILQRLAKNNG